MKTIADITSAYAAGASTPSRTVAAVLADIATRDGVIRAFTHIDGAGARDAAAASDRRWRAGAPLSALDGVPLTIKDNIAVAGLPLTAGMAHRRGVIAKQDAVVVARLRAAGAVIIGLSNMHEAALGSTTDNPFYGRTDNPAAPGCTPGGSSGGTAAAVAAGFVPFGIGSDTLGSVRLPASYCGVAGLKPTPGLLPVGGLIELSWSLDTVGPIGATLDDLAAVMRTIGGPEPGTAEAENVPDNWRQASEPVRLSALKLAIFSTGAAPIDDDVLQAFDLAIALLTRSGLTLPPVAIESWDPGRTRRDGLLIVEAEAAAVHKQELADKSPMSEELRAMLTYGRTLSAARLAEAARDFWAIGFRARQTLAAFDAVLLPVAPQTAFMHRMKAPASQADLTSIANAARLPALSLPLPVARGGKPVGLQLIGRRFDDMRLLAVAAAIEAELQA